MVGVKPMMLCNCLSGYMQGSLPMPAPASCLFVAPLVTVDLSHSRRILHTRYRRLSSIRVAIHQQSTSLRYPDWADTLIMQRPHLHLMSIDSLEALLRQIILGMPSERVRVILWPWSVDADV